MKGGNQVSERVCNPAEARISRQDCFSLSFIGRIMRIELTA